MTTVVEWGPPSHVYSDGATALLGSNITTPQVLGGPTIGVETFGDMVAFDPLDVPQGYLGAVQFLSNASFVACGNATALFGESVSIMLATGALLCDTQIDCAPSDVKIAFMPPTEEEAAQTRAENESLKATLVGLVFSFIVIVALPSQVAPILEEKVCCCCCCCCLPVPCSLLAVAMAVAK